MNLKAPVPYRVSLTARAQRDLIGIFDQIDAASSDAAWLWYRGLKAAIVSLEKLPKRCPETPERSQFRHLLYSHKPHIYRIVFRILERKKQVQVLHIRHGARSELKGRDAR